MDEAKIPPTPETIAQGKRLKRIRSILNCNQAEFAKKLGYSRASINYWEKANNGGLTFEGAITTIRACKKIGLICELDWLMYGEGAPPYLIGEISAAATADIHLANPISQDLEVALFKRNNLNHAILTLDATNASFPFAPGDILGGIWSDVNQCRPKEIIFAFIEEKGQLTFCKLEFVKNKKFLVSSYFSEEKIPIQLEKFARITRWWAKKKI